MVPSSRTNTRNYAVASQQLFVSDIASELSYKNSQKGGPASASGKQSARHRGVTRQQSIGQSTIKVIEWYFYPEFANKKLFKN